MKRFDFNRDWQFRRLGSDSWRTLSLPHDAMLEEARDPNCKNSRHTGYFPGGCYLYRRQFSAPKDWEGKTVLLELEGVYQTALIRVNGVLTAQSSYGYNGIFVDLSDSLHWGRTNCIEVEADNSAEPNSRWYTGSGIYRPVWLHVGEAICIRPEDVMIQTLSHDPATVRVRTAAPGADSVRVTVLDGERAVASADGQDAELIIPDARLWRADAPNLYQCRVEAWKDGVCADCVTQPFGIAHITWSTSGLFVNGAETLLRGSCIHHDNGLLGACEFPHAARRRIQILKDAGFNAIRSAHNPCSKALLDACDELGMYVMDEFSDMWYEHKNRWDYASVFETAWEQDLAAMIRKDISHPSVIMYSIGNEVTETAQPDGIRYARQLTELVHRLDATRPVTCGINMALNTMHFAGMGVYQPGRNEPAKPQRPRNQKALAALAEMMKDPSARSRASQMPANAGQPGGSGRADGKLVGSEYFNAMMLQMKEQQRQVVTQPVARLLSEDAFAELDIAGYNYADGRYALDGEEYPDRVSVGSETLPMRIWQNWQMVRKLPYLVGDFIWTGWDYLGEAGIGSFCYDSAGTHDKSYPALLAGCGIIDILGHPRPEVFWSKAAFGMEKGPHIAVEPVTHAGEDRLISAWRYSNAIRSWSWDGCEGRTAEVIVYADAPMVRLFQNGEQIGEAETVDGQALFRAVYTPGTLSAAAYDASGAEIGTDALQSAAGAAVLTVHPDRTALYATGQDLCCIDIDITDTAGILKPACELPVTVEVTGPGMLTGLGNADPFNTQSYLGSTHTTYYGRLQAIIRSTADAGEITVRICAPGCAPQSVVIHALPSEEAAI